MHELSIASAVVEIAGRHANGRPVSRVEVKVGWLRQVVPDSLLFAFELVSEGTELEGAELAIDEVPARVRCRTCAAETVLAQFPAHCGECGGFDVDVTAGEELLVESIEVDESRLASDAAGRAGSGPAARATDGSETWQRQVA